MVKLKPVLKDYLWGGTKLKTLFGRDNGDKIIAESWEASVHKDGESVLSTGQTLSAYLQEIGEELPVLIKYIDAKQNLSVQVHPSDEYARKYEGDNGKTETWYILSADEGAGIYCGLKTKIGKDEFKRKVLDGTVEEVLNFIPVKAGDCFLIKAGTLHAIGAGCVICEVQQNSNVTYRVYDYNRVDANGNKRALHVEKALDVIRFERYQDETGTGDWETVSGGKMRLLTECEYFRCKEWCIDGVSQTRTADSFTVVNVLEGAGTINGEAFVSGDTFFFQKGESVCIDGKAKCIVTTKP
ncbi:MAG: mannose-6-phosphate isomerase, class I [Clostridia bacterium]|nr:mannose-6-phosphate isomerase, class I [Clostridia bacterium]